MGARAAPRSGTAPVDRARSSAGGGGAVCLPAPGDRTRVARCCAAAALLLAAAIPASALVGGTSTSEFRNVGSGVQISPNWVIIARHLPYTSGIYSNGWGRAAIAARPHPLL